MQSRRSFIRSAVLAGAALGPLGAGLGGATRALAQSGTSPDGVNALLGRYVPTYDQAGVPRGLRLSFADDVASRRTATWVTSDVAGGSFVQWGVVGRDAAPEEVRLADLTSSQRGSSEIAPFGDGDLDDIVNGHRDIGPDVHHGERQVHVHRATLSGLEPGQRIAYRVGDGDRWSDVRLTDGGPLADRQFRFTHVGDHGPSLAAQRTTRALMAQQPDWHLFSGDLSYANGDQRIWDVWSEQYSVMGGSIPTMASPGNHEAKDFNGQTYRTRFTHPNRGASYFAWTHGNVFMASTPAGAFFGDVDGALEDIQLELVWMEHTLARAAAMRAAGLIDFIVVTQHFPSFTHEDTRGPISADRVIVAEQILQRYQIDLLLVGHDHMYQRSYPMAYGVPTSGLAPYTNHLGLTADRPERFANATGYIEVIAGAGGHGMYEFTEVDTTTLDPDSPQFGDGDPYYQRKLPWLAASARKVSFGQYDVAGPEMEVTAFGFDDGYDANTGNGVADDDVAYDANDPRFLADAEPDVIDRFTLVRKAYAGEVPTTPRTAREVLADLPEAHGVLRYNLAEDCTTHDH